MVSAVSPFSWTWCDQPIHYLRMGHRGQPLLLVHGFGASSHHWTKNIPALAEHHQVYALDLLGFGHSGKPNWDYRTTIWVDQLSDFCQQVIREPVVVAGNSLGGYVALSLAVDLPQWVRGVILLNSAGSFSGGPQPSLWQRGVSSILQWGLHQKPIAHALFHYIRQPQVIRNKLRQVYYVQEAITDELVEAIHRPSCDPGAAEVFAALMRGGQKGRTVDQLLLELGRPLLLIWGEHDPWMRVQDRSQRYRSFYPQLEEHFLSAGHCPHDEVPAQVNEVILSWLSRMPSVEQY